MRVAAVRAGLLLRRCGGAVPRGSLRQRQRRRGGRFPGRGDGAARTRPFCFAPTRARARTASSAGGHVRMLTAPPDPPRVARRTHLDRRRVAERRPHRGRGPRARNQPPPRRPGGPALSAARLESLVGARARRAAACRVSPGSGARVLCHARSARQVCFFEHSGAAGRASWRSRAGGRPACLCVWRLLGRGRTPRRRGGAEAARRQTCKLRQRLRRTRPLLGASAATWRPLRRASGRRRPPPPPTASWRRAPRSVRRTPAPRQVRTCERATSLEGWRTTRAGRRPREGVQAQARGADAAVAVAVWRGEHARTQQVPGGLRGCKG